jgi:DNA polymerase-4
VTATFAEPILHVDMDAFFVEVERLEHPELRNRPVVVGGTGPRAVVAAASYEARAFGVGSAMPMSEARRRCPQAIVVPPDHSSYTVVSRRVFEVLRSFTPQVEGLSVDEAFLDVSGLRLHYPSPAAIGAAIRDQIRAELGLPASVGGGANKFIAKLASEDAKPDGMLIVPEGSELAFLHPLPVRRLWGVGEATLAALEVLGIATVGDLAAVSIATLEHRLGRSLGRHLWDLANGRDDRLVVPGGGAKSISVEQTYDTDISDDAELEKALLRHCDRLSARLNASGLAGRTVALKFRFGDFTTVTRSITVADPVDHTPDLYDLARSLLAKIDRGTRGVRLLGVGASTLVPRRTPRQMSLEHPRRDAAAVAAEQVRERFGAAAVIPARLAPSPPASDESDGGKATS